MSKVSCAVDMTLPLPLPPPPTPTRRHAIPEDAVPADTAAIDARKHRYDWALEALDNGWRQRAAILGDDNEDRFWHAGHARSHWPGRARVVRQLLKLAWRAARAGDGATARRIMWQPRRSWLVLSLVRAKLTVSDEAMLSILRGSWIAGGAAVRETATQRRLYLTWARQLQLQKMYERRRPDVILQCGDKLLFSRFLCSRGVPTPRVFDLRRGRLPRQDLFVKPRYLDGGRHVETYAWRDDAYVDEGGTVGWRTRVPGRDPVISPEALWRKLAPASNAGGVLVQERLRNTDRVRALVGENAALCTFRVVTAQPVDLTSSRAAGGAAVVGCAMRMPSNTIVPADNYSDGGIFCNVDWRAERLAGPARDLFGNLHARHPNTGAPIDGRLLPGARAMVERCAALHDLLCAEYFADAYPWIGWDATLTAGGAGFHVLEVNPVSGPGFQLVCGPHLGDPTAREIFAQVPRYPWSCLWPRWATPFAWRSSDPVSRATPGRRAELEAKKARGT